MFFPYGLIVLVLFLGTTIFNVFVSVLNYRYRTHPIPEAVQDIYQESKYQKWLVYFMDNFRFDLVKQIINAILIVTLLFGGVFGWIYKGVESMTSDPDFQVLLFVGAYFLMSFAVETVFGYYQTFHVEEKHGFNKSTKKTFWVDRIKTLVLTVVLGGGLLYAVANLFSSVNSFFYIGTFLILVAVIVIANLIYVKLIVPLFNKVRPLEDGELKDAINAFAKKVGFNLSSIGVIDASKRSTKLNAYFSGFGKAKKIILYDTLIDRMTTEQIVAVLAHEVGHYKHKHILWGMAGSTIIVGVYMALLYLILNIPGFYPVFGFSGAFLGFGLILFLVLLSPMEILLGLLINGISRKHEYQADAYSAKTNGKTPMEEALKELARNNFSNLTPHPLFVKLSYSHPPIGDRISAIEKISDL